MSKYDLLPEERETHLNMTGDDHNGWEVFTDDPYWINRLRKLGIEPFKQVGLGFKFKLSADQVLIRKGKPKRELTDTQREALIQRAKAMRKTLNGNKKNVTQNGEPVSLVTQHGN